MKERKKEKKKTPLIVDTQFRDSARKPLGPMLLDMDTISVHLVYHPQDVDWGTSGCVCISVVVYSNFTKKVKK